MPRNFDEERDQRIAERRARWSEEARDRSFVLGGEVFEYADFIPDSAFMLLMSIGPELTNAEVWTRVDSALPELVALGESAEERSETLARLHEARTRVEYLDVQRAAFWILEEHLGRPTQGQSSSGGLPGKNGAESTVVSSSPPVASAASTD